MSRLGESIIRLLTLLALVPSVANATKIELQVALSVLVVLFVFRLRRSAEEVLRRVIPVAGFAIPLIPWVGSEVVIILALLVVLVLVPLPGRMSSLRWATPLFLFLSGSVLAELFSSCWAGSQGLAYLSLVRLDEWPRARDALRTLVEAQVPSLNAWARFFLLVIAIEFFSARADLRERWVRGLWGGSFVSALFALLQSAGLLSFTLSNQTPFWTSIHRVSGLMSDPNALGVMMIVALWCRFVSIDPRHGWRGGEWLVAASIVGAGIVAGSRTFLLGLFLLVCATTFARARRVFVGTCVVVIVSLLGVSLLDLYTPWIGALVGADGIPEGIRRGVMALSVPRLSETIFSRRIFFEIGVALWRESPWFGVGADHFRAYVPIVGARLGNLRGWVDNSNNFYLGLLAEIGVVGALIACATAFSRGIIAGFQRSRAAWALLAVAAMLLTGPHLDFPEVLLVVGCLIGSSTVARTTSPLQSPIVWALSVAMGVLSASAHERGIYGWREQGGVFERWLTPDARVRVACEVLDGEGEGARLLVSPLYIPRQGGLHVRIMPERGEPYTVSLLSQEPHQVRIPCDPSTGDVWLRVITTPPWSPGRAWPESSRDFRILGVRQLLNLKSR